MPAGCYVRRDHDRADSDGEVAFDGLLDSSFAAISEIPVSELSV
jgi:hypothetical protein